MATSTFKIYSIEGIDYDAVIAKYRQLCEEGEREISPDSISVFGNTELMYVQVRKPRKPLKDDARILNKAIYLVHTIAYRQATNQEEGVESVSLQMSVLQKVLGEDVYELLRALKECGYISIYATYVIGKSSRHYKVNGSIITEGCSNFTIYKYIAKTKELLKEAVYARLTAPEFKALYGENFAERYIKNLNLFKIRNIKGFEKFVNEQIKQNPDVIPYYNFLKESFKSDLKIYSIDGNNRIYHILTSLKRELKEYINIRFSIDCRNSHPLLFNYFIFYSKGISIDLSYLISSILFNYSIHNSNNHYDIEKLCNILIENNIDKSIIAKFTDDELLYIYKTTTGRFWDDILQAHSDYDRAEIKEKMFAEVFYSKTSRIAWKEFAKEFKAQYPNVYSLILRWKEPLKHEDLKSCLLARKKAVQVNEATYMDSQETALPNVMMDLESEIFREVLKSLYRKRIPCIHIHDAVVVPDSRAKVDIEDVEAVMRAVYQKYGLHPTFSVDTY